MATITRDQVETMSGPELVAAYKSITGIEVARFASREKGVARVLAALAGQGEVRARKRLGKGERPATPAPAPVPEPAAPSPQQPAEALAARAKRIDWSAKPTIKPHRPGTKRACVIGLLKRPEGATWEEVMQATGWDRRTAYEGVKLVHSYLGYGIREDGEGRMRIVCGI